MSEKKSRAEKAGERLGCAIIEMANLMYQENTKSNFYRGLFTILRKHIGKEKQKTPNDYMGYEVKIDGDFENSGEVK